MDILDIGRTDGGQILRLKLLLQVFRDQTLQDLLANLSGELPANDGDRNLTGTEPADPGVFSDVFNYPAGFRFHDGSGNGNFQGVLATFD